MSEVSVGTHGYGMSQRGLGPRTVGEDLGLQLLRMCVHCCPSAR